MSLDTATSAAIDPCVCPLCGQPNQCAMESSRQSGLPVSVCWCLNQRFSPELLARVPEAAQRKACICRRCAEADHHG